MEPTISASNPPTNLSPLTSIPDSSKITVPREAIPPSSKTEGLDAAPLISGVLKASSQSEEKAESEESARFAKAKEDILKNCLKVAYNIPSYNLSPQHVVEIAKLIILHDRSGASTINAVIKNLPIADQAARVELAKLSAQTQRSYLARDIANYAITDQDALVEIAKLAIQSNPYSNLIDLHNFRITNQTALVEILKLALMDDGIKDYDITKNFPKFGITDQAALVELAKFMAPRSWFGISSDIHKLGITDQAALVEIAEVEIRKNFSATLQDIANYRITDQAALAAMARFAAKKDGFILSDHIGKFGITDQSALFEIATLAIRNNPRSYIAGYGLTSQAHLVALAEQAVQLNKNINLSQYGITSQADLMIIAKLILQNLKTEISRDTLENLFDLVHAQNNRVDLVSVALWHSHELDWNTCNTVFREFCGKDLYAAILEDVRRCLPQMHDKTEKQSDPVLKARTQEWVGMQQMHYTFLVNAYAVRALAVSSYDKIPTVEDVNAAQKEVMHKFESLKLPQLFSQLFALGSMRERTLLAKRLFQFLYVPENLALFARAMQGMPEKCLLPIALACLCSQDAAVVQNFGRQIQEISRLDDGPRMRQWSMLLFQLSEADLTPDQKNNLLLKQFVEHAYDVHALLDELPFRSKVQVDKSEKEVKGEVDKKAQIEKSQNLVEAFLKEKAVALKLEPADLKKLAEKLSPITRPRADKENILVPLLITKFLQGKRWNERLHLLNTLVCIGRGAKIAQAHSLSLADLQDCLRKEIMTVFELNEKDFASEEDFRNAWQKSAETPFQERHPQALFVYASKINSLIGDERTTMKKLFSQFVSTLLKGPEALHKWRMECPHFDAVDRLLSASPEDKTTLEKWNVFKKEWSAFPTPENLSPFIAKKEKSEKNLSNQFQELLENTLKKDGHVANWESQLTFLHRYLHTSTSGPFILKELSEIPSDPQNDVQRVCLQLCTATTSSAAEMLLPELSKNIADLKKANAQWNLWSTDIENFVKGVAEAKKGLSSDKWKIGLTRDPVDMLLLASETSGCQSIDGDPQLNKCALAYVIDYKNSAIVIQDEDGKIKFRAILRVLYDKKNRTPVLFLERPYSSIADGALCTALNTYAVKYAAQVGWPLLTTEAMQKSEALEYAGTADSFGSNAALEYSDAGGGVTHGAFHIAQPFRMS